MRITINSKKILFIHIPKTGGISIERALLTANDTKRFPRADLNILFGDVEKNKKMPYQHLTMGQIFNDFKFDEIDTFDFIFCVVRNPYERVISEINWLKCDIDNYFNDLEKNILRVRAEGYSSEVDTHVLTQYSYIDKFEDRIKIYKFEDGLRKIFDDLEIILDKKIPDVHENLSKKTYTKENLLPNYKKIINIHYKVDFEKFNYEYENND